MVDDYENDLHDGGPCRLKELSLAMYAAAERRTDSQRTRAIILLSDPEDGAEGHIALGVFGYPRDDEPVRHIIEDMAHQLAEFGESFGEHIDVYVNGVRLTTGRASPNAS